MHETKSGFRLVPAVLFTILAVLTLPTLFSGGFPLWPLVSLAGLVVLAVAGYTDRRANLPVIGFLLLAAVVVIQFFGGFVPDNYSGGNLYSAHDWYSDEYRFVFLAMLAFLVNAVAYLAMAAVSAAACTDRLEKYRAAAEKFWFVPAILLAAVPVIGLIGQFTGDYCYGLFLVAGPAAIIHQLLVIAAYVTFALWAVRPDLVREENYGKGYCGIVKHLLLYVFTFGIWWMIWTFHTTRYLNRVEEAPAQRPGVELLLCLFVPFYHIYWMYKNARRVDLLCGTGTEATAPASAFALLCTLARTVLPFIPLPSILMQDRINAFVRAEEVPACAIDNPDELPAL